MSNQNPLRLSFDIGHSSIGWAVTTTGKSHPDILGCGSVLFPKDDCLSSTRRNHRRTRRNIRATRQRIERIKQLLLHLGVLSEAQLDEHGHAAPHLLAARALQANGPNLTWHELWHLLRWYAHNRGYDGNSRWSREQIDDDGDTEKEKAALELMDKHGTDSMAETICAVLGLKLDEPRISSAKPYKTLNSAFPRKVVRNEVLTLLEKHKGHLSHLDDNFIDTLIARDETKGKQAWATIPVPSIQLPRRYFGGLLFGQLIPRFDNRIISKCPISGDKVPNKACKEFLQYRWAMILANLKANGQFLTPEQRQDVHAEMKKQGRMTGKTLRETVETICQTEDTNCKSYFEVHPDSADALALDPALAYFHSGDNKPKKNTTTLAHFWPHIPEISKHRALGRWKKGRPVTLEWMLTECTREGHTTKPLRDEIERHFEADQNKKKPSYLTHEHFLRRIFAPKLLSGRAPYSRKVMQEVFDFVLSTDRHPTEADKPGLPAGPIYRTSEILKAERDRPIDDLTNNHLIRHRLTILLRLVDDILKEYADNNPLRISDIIVEVASDLQQYSGLTAKEMSGELTKRLSHHKAAVKYLEENAPQLEINASLIRKCRIAMDMDWHCPFTNDHYQVGNLPQLEIEHIIPYADRPTNALDGLVLTWPEVNRMKGKRTGLQFCTEEATSTVPGRTNLQIQTPKNYKSLVDKLKVAKKDTYPDDYRRQSARKKWLMVESYELKDQTFTAGALTQTSHLNRLSARQLEKRFADPDTGGIRVHITSIPGQVTAATRKGWRVLHTLDHAVPECAGRNKTEIRNITHLHHALDAAVLGLTHHYLPGTVKGQKENEKGTLWRALLTRNKSKDQIDLLMNTGLFAKHYKTDRDGNPEHDKRGNKKLDVHLQDLPDPLKEQLRHRLAEKRVVQHIPADQSGAALEQNPWRVRHIEGSEAIITQWNTGGTGDKAISKIVDETTGNLTYKRKKQPSECKIEKGKRLEIDLIEELISRCPKRTFTKQEIAQLRRGILKITTEQTGKLVGLKDGKLKANKSALVIESNYGLALDPTPKIIPFHKVCDRLATLAEENKGKHPRILRNGMLIRISNWKGKEGIWKIYSCKASLTLDLGRPAESKATWREVSVVSLQNKNALEILHPPLIGLSLKE